MEIRVFNRYGRPVTILYKDILSICMSERKICYITDFGKYYSARNLSDLAKLYERDGMFQIDKNVLINLKHVDHLVKGDAYIRGEKYPVARRRKPDLNKKWKNRRKDTD